MTCTVKELLDYYNIDVEAPQYMLDTELPLDSPNAGEYSKETHDGKEVHVFTTQGKIPDGDEELKIENILDLNDGSWTEIREWVGSDERPAYTSFSFIDPDDEDGYQLFANS